MLDTPTIGPPPNVGPLPGLDESCEAGVPICDGFGELLPLVEGAQRVPKQRPLPTFPPVRRDLSLVVPESMRYERIESLISGLQPPLMEELEYVTTYRGKPLEKGQKSVTVMLVFRSPTQTLTTEQVDATVQRVIDAAKSELGATLRA